jgi:hypothetical protein
MLNVQELRDLFPIKYRKDTFLPFEYREGTCTVKLIFFIVETYMYRWSHGVSGDEKEERNEKTATNNWPDL